MEECSELSFKPYYNWNTFNTEYIHPLDVDCFGFKPYYNWNTFNTLDFDKNTDFMVS